MGPAAEAPGQAPAAGDAPVAGVEMQVGTQSNMSRPGRKPRQITVRTVGTPSDAALAGFARLLLAREQARPALTLVPPPAKKATLSRS